MCITFALCRKGSKMKRSALTIIAIILVGGLTIFWLINLIYSLFLRIFKKKAFSFSDTLLLKALLEKTSIKTKVIAVFVFVVALVLVILDSVSLRGFLGINKLENSINGTYCFYVNAKNMDSKAIYTLPAEIEIYNDPDPEFGTSYYIKSFYFDDGTCSSFPNGDPFGINDKDVHMTDANGIEWECSLINKRAYNGNIIESKGYHVGSLIGLLLMTIAVLYNTIGCFVKEENGGASFENS